MAAKEGDASAAWSGQLLTFRVGDETYAVDILRVKEIRVWSAVSRIPKAPPHMLGVLNLRGAIVPVIDLRLRFALESAEFSPTTVTIVLTLSTEEGVRECGVVVDSVSDVVEVAAEAIRPAPALGNGRSSGFISGLVAMDDRMMILLDVDELILHDLRPADDHEAAA